MELKKIYNKPITLKPYHTLDDAKNKMIKSNISRIVIEDDGRPLGIITEKDIAKIMLKENRLINEIMLEEVMSKDLVMVDESASLKRIAELMLEKGISSILVVEKDRLKGIITKSDLASFYASNLRGKYKVREYMSKDVITVNIDDTVQKVLEVMNDNNISRVVVARNKEPIGIVTYRNLLPLSSFVGHDTFAVISEIFRNNREAFKGISIKTFVRDVMDSNLITIGEDKDLADAAEAMFKNRISGIPVVNGILKGIITKTDITKAIADIQ